MASQALIAPIAREVLARIPEVVGSFRLFFTPTAYHMTSSFCHHSFNQLSCPKALRSARCGVEFKNISENLMWARLTVAFPSCRPTHVTRCITIKPLLPRTYQRNINEKICPRNRRFSTGDCGESARHTDQNSTNFYLLRRRKLDRVTIREQIR